MDSLLQQILFVLLFPGVRVVIFVLKQVADLSQQASDHSDPGIRCFFHIVPSRTLLCPTSVEYM